MVSHISQKRADMGQRHLVGGKTKAKARAKARARAKAKAEQKQEQERWLFEPIPSRWSGGPS
ncbi:MAG: hypothetical protein WCC27_10655, partial [Acidobacteriaceae bacterium]